MRALILAVLLTACGTSSDPVAPVSPFAPGPTVVRLDSARAGPLASSMMVYGRNTGGAGQWRVVMYDDPQITSVDSPPPATFMPRVRCTSESATAHAYTVAQALFVCADGFTKSLWFTLEGQGLRGEWQRTACIELGAQSGRGNGRPCVTSLAPAI